MSNELIIASATTGLTVYGVILNQSGYYWNGTTFEIFTAANYVNYPVTMTEQGATGVYLGNFPMAIVTSGNYTIIYYTQSGGSPANGDAVIGTGVVTWNGVTSVGTSPSPTLSSLVTEALKLAGDSNPTTTLTTRAQDNWIEQIKNDIWRRCKVLKSLQQISAIIFNQGQSLYSMPSDYAGQGEISMRLLDGTHSGIAQAATSSSLTLATSETALSGFIVGKEILVMSGTGIRQISQVTAYDSTTKIATVSPSWTTTPAALDTYLIIDKYTPLDQAPVWNFDTSINPYTQGQPARFYPRGNESYGQFILDVPPSKAYGALVRYYVNIMTIDPDGTLMETLYAKYRNLWIQGIFSIRLTDLDDGRATAETQKYLGLLADVIGKEQYGEDIHTLQATVSD